MRLACAWCSATAASAVTPLALPLLLALARTCAPGVAPETLLSVAYAESRFDPLAIGVNAKGARALTFESPAAAAAAAEDLQRRGVDFDIGLAQINARNLRPLGLTAREALDPCRNLAAGGRILARGYRAADPVTRGPQPALVSALSTYSTGDPERGLRNGYVARVKAAAQRVVPALQSGSEAPPLAAAHEPSPSAQAPREIRPTTPRRPAPGLDVFDRAQPRLVWATPSPTDPDPTPVPEGDHL